MESDLFHLQVPCKIGLASKGFSEMKRSIRSGIIFLPIFHFLKHTILNTTQEMTVQIVITVIDFEEKKFISVS